MSLDKAIAAGKEKRKQYYGTKAIDRTCRNHGSCSYCECSRLHSRNKAEAACKEEMKEWRQNEENND